MFPTKDICKDIPQRRSLTKEKLTQTNWFKNQIIQLLKP